MVVADQFNQLQQQGITLDNNFGSNLFRDVNDITVTSSRVLASSNNLTTDQVVALTVTDSTELTTSDYTVAIRSGGTYSIMRNDDRVEVAGGVLPGAFPTSITFDGLSLDITSGTFSAGDEFLLRPTRYGASEFAVMPLQPDDIALGSPVATDTTLGNLGTATISPGEVLSVVDASGNTLPLFAQTGAFTPPFLIQFTTPTTYDILDNSNPGNPVQLDPPIRNQIYVPGIQNPLFTTDSGETTLVSNGTALGLPAGSAAVASGTGVNGYDAETFTFVTTDPDTGATSSEVITTSANDSTRTIASLVSGADGVTATAFNYLELRDFSLTLTAPLQITLNGEDLVAYDGAAINGDVPSPALNSGEDFNDYLAQQINDNTPQTRNDVFTVVKCN